MHLYLYYTITAARFATPAFYIEAESSLSEPSHLSFRQSRKQISYSGEHPCISSRIRSGRSAYRGLVYIDHFIYIFNSEDLVMVSRFFKGFIGDMGHSFIKDFIHQAALARPRDSGNAY